MVRPKGGVGGDGELENHWEGPSGMGMVELGSQEVSDAEGGLGPSLGSETPIPSRLSKERS